MSSVEGRLLIQWCIEKYAEELNEGSQPKQDDIFDVMKIQIGIDYSDAPNVITVRALLWMVQKAMASKTTSAGL